LRDQFSYRKISSVIEKERVSTWWTKRSYFNFFSFGHNVTL